MSESKCYSFRTDDLSKAGGIGFGEEVSPTLCRGGDVPVVIYKTDCKCYGICSYASNAMLSDNPHSGIYEAKTARTLDLNGGNPCCHQGGVLILQKKPKVLAAIEGNGSRPSHRGGGYK